MSEVPRSTEVAVIGGGIIGCSIAYYLSKAGVNVVVIEKSWLGSGASCANQGVVGPYMAPPPIFELMMESLRMYYELGRELRYDIGLEQVGMVIPAITETEAEVLEEHSKALRRSGGSPRIVDGGELRELDPTFSRDIAVAQVSSEDCVVDPVKVVFAYAKAASELGAKVFRYTEVVGIKVSNGSVKSVVTTRGEFRVDYVVDAAGAWAGLIGRMVGAEVPVYPMRGHVLVTEPYKHSRFRYILDAKYIVEAFNVLTPKVLDDEFSKYRIGASLCQHKEGNWTIGASRDAVTYDKDVSLDVVKSLLRRAVMIKPCFKHVNVIRVFTGLRPYSNRKLPIIEEASNVEGFIVASGHKGEGVALAPLTGKVVAELITRGDVKNPLVRRCYELVGEPLGNVGRR